MRIRDEYVLAGFALSIACSIGSAVYSYISNKKFEKIEGRIEKDYASIERATRDRCKDIEDDIEERLKRKVNGIADSLNVDVPDVIVEEALKKAAEMETKRSIEATSREILTEYKQTMRSEVRKSVDLAYENTKVDVKKELTRQIENIDISGIKRDVVKDAKDKIEDELEKAIDTLKEKFEEDLDNAREKAQEKFEDELDTISTKFSSDLERGSKIYKAIQDKLGS